MVSHAHTTPPLSGLTRLLTVSSLLWLVGLLTLGYAQITLDGSLGPRGPLIGPNYRIGAELGQLRGSNLFHSFGEFNVPTGGSATFTGPHTIVNILSRVTGGQASVIDGLLRSDIAGANLYLLNPSGVLFGPNASVEVSGSFHVDTADFLRFADGATFAAHLGQASVLTVASPTAFGFLGNNPAAITIQGSSLKVSDGKALSAVGGDITMVGGSLKSPSGRTQLASVMSPGEVMFNPLELAPDLQVQGFARLGRITLSQGANVTVSSPAGAGAVLIRGGRLLVDNTFINARTTGAGKSAPLGIDVRVAEDVVLTNGGQLITLSSGAGRAGDVQVTAGGSVAIVGRSGLFSTTEGWGQGGDLEIVARHIQLSDGGTISANSSGTGDTGTIRLQAGETFRSQNGTVTTASDQAGGVRSL